VTPPWLDESGQPQTLDGRWAGKELPGDGPAKTLAVPGEGSKFAPLYFDRRGERT